MKKIWTSLICNLILLVLAISFVTCDNNSKPGEDDNPTSGSIKISIDETFAPVVESQVSTFQQIYQYAKIHAEYKPEEQAFDDLIADSVRLIIATRKLNSEEEAYFKKIKIYPKTTTIAYDGITLIVNNDNNNTELELSTLKEILSGRINKWKQLSKSSTLSDIQIVFDNPSSSTVRYIKDFIGTDSLPKNSYAVKSNQAVLDYVSENRNSIGIIGVNWISDFDDSNSQNFLKKVKVVGLKSNNPKADSTQYYKPYQAYIAKQYYPLMRSIYLINREARAGLGLGFASFVAGEKGQRIMLKSGLVPAIAPLRLVEIYQ